MSQHISAPLNGQTILMLSEALKSRGLTEQEQMVPEATPAYQLHYRQKAKEQARTKWAVRSFLASIVFCGLFIDIVEHRMDGVGWLIWITFTSILVALIKLGSPLEGWRFLLGCFCAPWAVGGALAFLLSLGSNLPGRDQECEVGRGYVCRASPDVFDHQTW